MSSLEPDSHFEPAGNQIAKPQAPLAVGTGQKGGMRLDDHTLAPRHHPGHLLVIARRKRRRVELVRAPMST